MERSPFCGVHGVKCENFTRYQKVKSRFSPGEKKIWTTFHRLACSIPSVANGCQSKWPAEGMGQRTGYPEAANSSRRGRALRRIQPLRSLVCQWGRPSTRFLICKVGTAHICLGRSLTSCMKHLVKKRYGSRGSPYSSQVWPEVTLRESQSCEGPHVAQADLELAV